MRFAYHVRLPKQRQIDLCNAIVTGAAKHGDEVFRVDHWEVEPNVDGMISMGISLVARQIFDKYREAGLHTVHLDKGYTRDACFRVAVDAFQPLAYLGATARPPSRLRTFNVTLEPYRNPGTHILFDGASGKYCQWYGFGDPVVWSAGCIAKIKRFTDLPVIYRPRPSHNPTREIPGAELSQRALILDLARARVVVSNGGNIGWDAVIAGVPHFAMGDSIARPVSETNWSRVDQPCIPDPVRRLQWAANVLHCQWTLEEFASGIAWSMIKEQLVLAAHFKV